MKKLPIIVCAIVALLSTTLAAPEAEAFKGCRTGRYADNRAFFSYCPPMGERFHHFAEAAIYFNKTGKTQWRWSPHRDPGKWSMSGIFYQGKVVSGPRQFYDFTTV